MAELKGRMPGRSYAPLNSWYYQLTLLRGWEVLRRVAVKFYFLLSDGVDKFYRCSVKGQAWSWVLFGSVDPVADDGVPDMRHVDTDLMGAAGKDLYFQKSGLAIPLNDFVLGVGLSGRSFLGDRHSVADFSVAADGVGDMPLIKLHSSPD